MHKAKIEKCFVHPSVTENIAQGQPVIDGCPRPNCKFVLDQSIEVDEYWPLAMGCIENATGDVKHALIAVSEPTIVMRGFLRATGKPPCSVIEILYM